MRGLGESQQKIKESNMKKVLFEIKLASNNGRFCTINYIHKFQNLNHKSIRNYIKSLIESGDIVEYYQVYNNARCFVTSSTHKKLKSDRNRLEKFAQKTSLQIYDLKYPHMKDESDTGYLRSGKSGISDY